MEIFIQVMESGNFTRAADALGVPRSTVSTVVQALEDRLGTQLLRRSTRTMVATDEGERFLGKARELVDAVNETDRMFRQDASRLRGRLRIDMPSRIGRRIVIPALPELFDQHPDLKIEISTTDRLVDLVSEGIDCVVRVGALQDSDIICRKLGDVDIVTCGSPTYFERHGVPRTVKALASHRMVNYCPTLGASSASFDYRTHGRPIKVPMMSDITVSSAESYIAAALAGLGLIQIPAFDVHDLMRSDQLMPVLKALRPPQMQLSLLYARRRNVPARIEVFQQWVSELLRREGVFAGT